MVACEDTPTRILDANSAQVGWWPTSNKATAWYNAFRRCSHPARLKEQKSFSDEFTRPIEDPFAVQTAVAVAAPLPLWVNGYFCFHFSPITTMKPLFKNRYKKSLEPSRPDIITGVPTAGPISYQAQLNVNSQVVFGNPPRTRASLRNSGNNVIWVFSVTD